jgi:hypothetical protein
MQTNTNKITETQQRPCMVYHCPFPSIYVYSNSLWKKLDTHMLYFCSKEHEKLFHHYKVYEIFEAKILRYEIPPCGKGLHPV